MDFSSASVEKYRGHLRSRHDESLKRAGVAVNQKINEYTVALNGYSAILSKSQVTAIAAQEDVLMVMEDRWRYPDTESSPGFLGINAPAGAWQTGYTGEGVVVGVIDSGIWPEHPSFADDGSYPAAPVLDNSRPNCDFGNAAHNPADAPFACNNKLIGARQMLDTYRSLIGASPEEYDSARDDNGHGTHTASTAAGNNGVFASVYGLPLGPVSGIAPRAHIVAYKGLGSLGGFTSDLAAAIDQAVLDGVDVINYSIGGGSGLPGGDAISFLFAANAGVHVASSAGNSGPGRYTLGNPGTMPWLTTVGANTQSRFFEGRVILGDGTEFAGASITSGVGETGLVDGANAGDEYCSPGSLNPSLVSGNIVLCRRGLFSRTTKSQAVFDAGGVGTILYNNDDDGDLFTDSHWTPAVHIDNTPGLAVKAYIAGAGAGATANIECCSQGDWPAAPSMTSFSSRGPNPVALDIIKPDITAPGIQILAGNSPTPIGGVQGELFQAIGGTSMSSPHVAGVFALIKQAHPDWTPAMAKSAIMTTAFKDVVDNDRSSQATPFEMGAGHLNPGGPVHKGSAFQPGLVYDAGLFEYAAFTCGMEWGVFSQGSCDFLENLGVPSDPSDLNLASIAVFDLSGIQTVSRTVTSVANENGWREYSVLVDAPPGFDVSVSPERIKLKRGETATYEVTISNISAPAQEWRFGSLTWIDKTGNFEVHSPIAVSAAPFSAPASISGSGESGSASFDVIIGGSSSYSAAPHGLETATVTTDNVDQDPDQGFDPNDGYSNLHQFSLSGALHFRVAMPPEATEPGADLDIFVFDPFGVLVAASTHAFTDELVDIPNPVDGTWSVFVHGWTAPGGDSDYDMYSWVLSATPGGSLSVDSAPVSGDASGTIDISWVGATAGEWHLGAVSHSGCCGLLGVTIVDVDNR